ncbi:hypothetical protein J4444_00365 [Candidatus Woesearchaeota archaeon]|nr:hypothetical protein [Candidatus Woesearchaeota archaeon]
MTETPNQPFSLERALQAHIDYGSKVIFQILRSPDENELGLFNQFTRDSLEPQGPSNHQLNERVYIRRLMAGIAYKRSGSHLNAAYCLDKAGRAAFHSANDFVIKNIPELKPEYQMWYARAASLRFSAARLFESVNEPISATYSYGFGSAALYFSGKEEEGYQMVLTTLSRFMTIGASPEHKLNKHLKRICREHKQE